MPGDNVVLSTAAPSFPKTLTIKPGDAVVLDANGKSIAVNVSAGGAGIAHAPVTGLSTTADPAVVAAGSSFTVTAREQLTASGNGSAVIWTVVT